MFILGIPILLLPYVTARPVVRILRFLSNQEAAELWCWSTAMHVSVTEAELLSRWELCPPTSHPAGPAPKPSSWIRAKRSSKRAAPILENGASRPWPASAAAPSDRSGASHAYSVSGVIPRHVLPWR